MRVSRFSNLIRVCYSATILVYFANLGVIFSSSIPDGLRFTLIPAYIAFTNMVACRVFRGVALGSIENSPTGLGLTSTRIAAAFQLEPIPPHQQTTLDESQGGSQKDCV